MTNDLKKEILKIGMEENIFPEDKTTLINKNIREFYDIVDWHWISQYQT